MKYILLLSSIIVFCYAEKKFTIEKQSKEIFPNQVGDKWIYTFSGDGSSANSSNRIYITVTGEKILPNGKKAKVWAYQYPNGTDTNYVVSNGNEVKIYHGYNAAAGEDMPGQKWKYTFPFNAGKWWALDEEHGDSIKIISTSLLQVPAGKFNNTYLLINAPDKSVFIGNYHKIDSIWFTPYIGITRFFQNEFQMRPIAGNGKWELLKYILK